jgi:hypothetical protein
MFLLQIVLGQSLRYELASSGSCIWYSAMAQQEKAIFEKADRCVDLVCTLKNNETTPML